MSFYERSVTEYCERVGEGVFNEPLNFASNIVLIMAAFWAYSLIRKSKVNEKKYLFLSFLLLLVGIGSGLWHSFRNPFTHAMDFLPIFAFFLTFLYFIFHKLTNNKIKSLVLLITYFIFQVIISILFPEALNGSVRHVSNLIIFAFIIYWIYKKINKHLKSIYLSFLAYALGIVFRTIDAGICTTFPYGTHFLWHICTSIAAYFAIKALIEIERLNYKKLV